MEVRAYLPASSLGLYDGDEFVCEPGFEVCCCGCMGRVEVARFVMRQHEEGDPISERIFD